MIVDFKEKIIELLKKYIKLDELYLEIPKDNNLGDYAFPCFILAKEMKKNPVVIAKDLEKKISKPYFISDIKATGPYLNFFVDKSLLFKETLKKISKEKDNYGSGKNKKQKIMIEYSQANTHKAFHVGHLRGTSLGEALARILKFYGYDVVQANYQGDTGAHVSKWLWCCLKYHKNEKPPKDERGKWIASIYVEAIQKLTKNPELQEQVDEINYKLENDMDSKLTLLWKRSRKWSLDEFEEIYNDLDAHFDYYFFEREMEDPGKKMVDKILKKGLAEKSEGAIIINLEKYCLGVWVLLRKDGTTLYSAKDLALAEKKFNKFKIDKSIYVVGNAQSLHMKQLFKTLDLMGFKQAKDCYHLSFDEIRLPTGKMSSRTGVNILYTDLKKELFEYTEKETRARHKDWSEKKIKEIVDKVALGAMKFDILLKDSNKIIVFDIKKACDFEGETGPYVQYAHVRCCSILDKYGQKLKDDVDFSLIKERSASEVVTLLSKFDDIIKQSCDNYKLNILARYLIDLAQKFNEFYHECHVITDDKKLTETRLLIVDCVRQVLNNGLKLLAIDAPERM